MICSQEPRDVFLVVDGSLSIGETDFEKIRKFLVKLVKSVVVNPNMTHFGLLQFSTLKKTRLEFSLDYSHRESTLLNRIRNLRYQAGESTRTGNALKIVDKEVGACKISSLIFFSFWLFYAFLFPSLVAFLFSFVRFVHFFLLQFSSLHFTSKS